MEPPRRLFKNRLTIHVDEDKHELCLGRSRATLPDGRTITSVTCTQEVFNRAVDLLEGAIIINEGHRATKADLQGVKEAKHLLPLARGTKTEPLFKMFGVKTDLLTLVVEGLARRWGIPYPSGCTGRDRQTNQPVYQPPGFGPPAGFRMEAHLMRALEPHYQAGMAQFNNDTTKFAIVTMLATMDSLRTAVGMMHLVRDDSSYRSLIRSFGPGGAGCFTGPPKPGYARYLVVDISWGVKPWVMLLNPFAPSADQVIPAPW